MRSLILNTVSKILLPLLILFSVFVLLRGHNLPGGGFVGGLIAAIAFILHAFANGLIETKKLLRIHPGFLIPIGLLIAICSAMAPVILTGDPIMTGLWYDQVFPVLGKIGSSLFFDAGVYLVVVGACLTIIFTISEKRLNIMEILLAIMTGILYAAGIYMILRRSLVKLIIGIVILGNGVNLLIFLMGGLAKGEPPLITESGTALEELFADPVPQALILTAIVISFGLQSFAIVLIQRAYKVLKTDDIDTMNKTDEIS